MSLYIKDHNNKMMPVKISSVVGSDLNDKLVIIRVGTDDFPANMDDLNVTAECFSNADVIRNLDNVSIVVTPYQIDIDLVDESDIDEKFIYLQICSGEDVSSLGEKIKSLYKQIKKKYKNVVTLPTPLKIKEYKKVMDTLKRCKLRKKRRSRA